ncbi:tetratricopeptide repeat protein 1-like isoform X2 [Gordionus sp. m RMFG-2023]|uniref:tetratricopeptide repeat protein 1-like isoform X2 n=1 Tax=Gordionus sp. m RMFG-2023 TaxID=3053472 RepID=UPI0031FD82AC
MENNDIILSESEDDFYDITNDIENDENNLYQFKNDTSIKPKSTSCSIDKSDRKDNIEGNVFDHCEKDHGKTDNITYKEGNINKEDIILQRMKEENLLSPEELAERKAKAEELKNEGNKHYSDKNIAEALNNYTNAIKICPLTFNRQISIYYSNRAACHMQKAQYTESILDCNEALNSDPTFVKAYVRRAKAFESCERLEDALKDYQKILEIDKYNGPALQACQRLPPLINEKNEKLKTEMFA